MTETWRYEMKLMILKLVKTVMFLVQKFEKAMSGWDIFVEIV